VKQEIMDMSLNASGIQGNAKEQSSTLCCISA
jgi:hypothetical protein